MAIEKSLTEYWQSHFVTEPGQTVIVACSGGPDSLALLDLLWGLRDKLAIKVVAAHYEHGIRGQASMDDEAFVRDYCQNKGIPFYAESGNIPQLSRESGESLETCARRMRYAFLQQLAEGLNNALIATAHHADDQAETVLMHFLRGTGMKGLTGMLPKRDNLIRPLLGFTKAELVEYCRQQGLSPRLDATNQEPDCTRNKLRLQLLPLLQSEYNPNISQSLCQLAELTAPEEELLDSLCRQAADRLISQDTGKGNTLKCPVGDFLQEPLAIQRRLIQYMVGQLRPGKAFGFQHVEAVLELIKKGATGTSLNLSHRCLGKISYGFFYLSKNNDEFLTSHGTIKDTPYKIILKLGSKVELPGGGSISAFVTDSLEGEAPFSRCKIYCDAEKCGTELVVRYRQDGDRIRLEAGSKKLKDFFVDAKVERSSRDSVPLVVSSHSDEIIWVAGLRQTSVALADKDTKQYVILSYGKGEE
ncbi:tRNA(Ile)-lysidine synthetase [Anaerovibrio sp. JC8]|uniref:tRNA lysidine(34) synthetase TilS n=1 Tax=Anaerovibrio sp. JC8 TaxID=1240085 RepID=UPI000A0C4B76|nr:tRNA lysidine(34) synthetase TilS [Anaerovibrio sp. JC8]ORU00451.1 tRNA(Ile)-lysidine synthetase [Anaerovibrio sp. JC8]